MLILPHVLSSKNHFTVHHVMENKLYFCFLGSKSTKDKPLHRMHDDSGFFFLARKGYSPVLPPDPENQKDRITQESNIVSNDLLQIIDLSHFREQCLCVFNYVVACKSSLYKCFGKQRGAGDIGFYQ